MSESKYPALRPHLEQVIGYLNFSSGAHDPTFFAALDKVFLWSMAVPEPNPAEADRADIGTRDLPQQAPLADSPSQTHSVKKASDKQASDKRASDKQASGRRVPGSPSRPTPRLADLSEDSTRETGSHSVARLNQPPTQLQSAGLLRVYQALKETLEELSQRSSAFADCQQARGVLDLVFQDLLPAYRRFHTDLLFHLGEAEIFQSFFVARCFEVVLALGQPWQESERLVPQAIGTLNDYVGYRPVATLEQVRHQTYPHERYRPIPLFVRGAGVSSGVHHAVVSKALEILRQADPEILSQAYFDLDHLEELAIDVRAYDFDHPINKRPNYHFGLWDPDHIGPDGNYHRFVIHSITLDALLKRLQMLPELSAEDRNAEVAAVLAGTMLMGSCVSGQAPDSHDSSVTLSTLLPIIANFRDEFYDTLYERSAGQYHEFLTKDLKHRRQPFGGTRQHLNAELASRRAAQVQHVQLSKIYAKMGYTDAAAKQAAIVPVVSARITCQIDCLLSSATDDIVNRRLHESLAGLRRIEDLIHRGIDCGALLDPWCLLGFDGNFPLFPAMENSVPDHRADDLVAVVEHTLDVYSHLLGEAAASDETELLAEIRQDFTRLAQWWRQFAAHEVSSLNAVDAQEVLEAARHVADALSLWKKGGAAAGDLAFWSKHAAIFDSPKAYQLVIDALLERKDLVASQALLIHWLSQAAWLGLDHGETSYHELIFVWLGLQHERYSQAETFQQREDVWLQICKFYDYLEANADQYWQVPQFQLNTERGSGSSRRKGDSDSDPPSSKRNDPADSPSEHRSLLDDDRDDEFEGSDEFSNLFDAAYEDVVYNDSTNDGIDGQIFETNDADHSEMEEEAQRIIDRLSFLNTLALLWFEASSIPLPVLSRASLDDSQLARLRNRSEVLEVWVKQAARYETDLNQLLADVHAFQLPKGNGEMSSLMEYDRLRLMKETVMDRVMATSVEMQLAVRSLQAVGQGLAYLIGDRDFGTLSFESPDRAWILTFAGVLLRDVRLVDDHFDELLEMVQDKPLLYIPLSKGGNPHQMIETRVRQQCFQRVLASLPLLGLFDATYKLLKVARAMERNNNVGFGAVTEYDEMFRNGFGSMVQALIMVDQKERSGGAKKVKSAAEERLFFQLERLTEAMLGAWLSHSRTLRLSVMEKTLDSKAWESVVQFINRYGGQLFTQNFLNLGNIRAILHQGVETWLNQLQESNQELDLELLNDLDHNLQMSHAVKMLTLILEAVIENFSEYRDYNSTTTQSDRGDLLYTFLDFLRLRTKYDRVAWHLKPVVWAHAILVKNQENGAAGRWRRQLTERVESEADRYLAQLKKLQTKYAMRMPTVADRLSERFVQPLHIDRICALVAPAMHSPDPVAGEGAFELLQKEAEMLTKQPMGVGLEVPTWLIQLEQEVDQQRVSLPNKHSYVPESLIDPIPLELSDIEAQLDALPGRD